MARRRTRAEQAKLMAEVHEATLKWNATPLEEKMRGGIGYSTPGPRKEPVYDGPFAAWAMYLIEHPIGPFVT